jgi:hypothetical protein
MRSSSEGMCGIGSEQPVPGLSYAITRVIDPRRVKNRVYPGSAQSRSRCEMKPGAYSRSTGPEPQTW